MASKVGTRAYAGGKGSVGSNAWKSKGMKNKRKSKLHKIKMAGIHARMKAQRIREEREDDYASEWNGMQGYD